MLISAIGFTPMVYRLLHHFEVRRNPRLIFRRRKLCKSLIFTGVNWMAVNRHFISQKSTLEPQLRRRPRSPAEVLFETASIHEE